MRIRVKNLNFEGKNIQAFFLFWDMFAISLNTNVGRVLDKGDKNEYFFQRV